MFVMAWIVSAVGLAQSQDVVINEVMYHPLQPPAGSEPMGEEFIELFNRGSNAVMLYGWRFDRGVTFAFTNVSTNFALGPGGYLVVAASRTRPRRRRSPARTCWTTVCAAMPWPATGFTGQSFPRSPTTP
jgi:hypothetical protein